MGEQIEEKKKRKINQKQNEWAIEENLSTMAKNQIQERRKKIDL